MIATSKYVRLVQTLKTHYLYQSRSIKINHEQVLSIVVADLLCKYRAVVRRKDTKWAPVFKQVLLFYLEDEELETLMQGFDT